MKKRYLAGILLLALLFLRGQLFRGLVRYEPVSTRTIIRVSVG